MTNLPTGTVTFLFTDIEGSTQLAQQHRAQWEALRGRHLAILQQAMHAHAGYVFEVIGDALCVAFSSAIDALHAAVAAQGALHAESWVPAPIRVRMGIHTGTAHAYGEDGGYKGYTSLARTQRLMSAGHGGQVLLSLSTEQLVREELPEGVGLRDMGERRLKDLVLPERIYQLVIAGLPAEFPPLRTLDSFKHNLPPQLTSFIGREQELAEVAKAVQEHRLVTLTGPGGTGKTRLALQVAADLIDHFRDGVWFADLSTLNDSGLIPDVVLSALAVREEPGRSSLDTLKEYLRPKQLLVLIDGCDRFIEACARLVHGLVDEAPGLNVMATSRAGLGVRGEVVWHVGPLSAPDLMRPPSFSALCQVESVCLFVERATLVQPRFTLTTANAPAVAQVCFHLDGIPLAIELAAARVKALTPEKIACRLDDRFSLLTGGSPTDLPHHQTLRAAIDWSYELLAEGEQDMLQRLSVFAGGWSLEAAQAMATRVDPGLGNWLDLLTSLVDKSLVSHDPARERYAMLESVREYALDRLRSAGRLHACQSIHGAYFVEIADQAQSESVLDAGKEALWRKSLSHDIENLRQASRYLNAENRIDDALELAGALGWWWGDITTFAEGREWLEKIWPRRGHASAPARAKAAISFCSVEWNQGNFTEANDLAIESLEGIQDLGDHELTWIVLLMSGLTRMTLGEYAEAETLLGEALLLSRRVHAKRWILFVLNALGEVKRAQRDYATAEPFYRDALALAREIGDKLGEAVRIDNLGSLAYDQEHWAEARAFYEQTTQSWRTMGHKGYLSLNLSGLANVLHHEGEHVRSAQLQGFAHGLCTEMGARLQSLELAAFEATAAALKTILGEAAYQEAFEQGKSLTLDQAIELTRAPPENS